MWISIYYFLFYYYLFSSEACENDDKASKSI